MEPGVLGAVQEGDLLLQSMYEASAEEPDESEVAESVGDWTMINDYEANPVVSLHVRANAT
jgi:hypothetical protein